MKSVFFVKKVLKIIQDIIVDFVENQYVLLVHRIN